MGPVSKFHGHGMRHGAEHGGHRHAGHHRSPGIAAGEHPHHHHRHGGHGHHHGHVAGVAQVFSPQAPGGCNHIC